MIEKVILDYLTEELSIPVYMERPLDLPERWVQLERTSTSEQNKIRSCMMACQSYDRNSMAGAAALNEEVVAAMDQAIILPSISRCKLNNAYNFTDTATKEYRYQAVYDITYYEVT